MISLYLNRELQKHWHDCDIFQQVHLLDGEIFRKVATRRTLRFKLGDQYYFAKIHYGVGWLEILKNLILLRMPVLSAENEWQAIIKLKQLGISTMMPVGYGIKGNNPANLFSFIITEELVNTISLEELCENWLQAPPDPLFKRKLVVELANVSRVMHKSGINHRDYYICHFLLDLNRVKLESGHDITLYLIDLHRAQIRAKTPLRWLVKDIGGLYFSAMDIGLTSKDLFRFMKVYSGKSLRDILNKDIKFWRLVERRAKGLYKKADRHKARSINK